MSNAYSPPFSPTDERERQVKILSHSDLFYWWPVWVVRYVMALRTYWDGHVMAIVPAEQGLPLDSETGAPVQPNLRTARSNNMGVVFATVLVLVILITNVRLRGVWTAFVILAILFLAVLFAYFDVWDRLLQFITVADIHINAFGYLCMATTLFVFWLAVFVFIGTAPPPAHSGTDGRLTVRSEGRR